MPEATSETREHTGASRHYWVLTASVVVLAAILRWMNLGAWDMWTDEVQTLWVAQSGKFREGPMYTTAPINFWLTRASVVLFGANEIGERFPSFLAGVTAVAVFGLGFRRWLGETAAVIGALLLAIDPWHVGWSQTGRHFAPQMLFILIGALAFLKGWVDRRPIYIWGSAAALVLAIFTHSSSIFFVGTFLVFLGMDWLLDGRRGARKPGEYVKAAIPIAVVLLAYLPVFFGIGSYLLDNKPPWNPPWNIMGSLAFYIMPPLAGFAAAGAIVGWWERWEGRILFPLLILVPPLLIMASSQFTIASAAYLLSLLPFVIALASMALVRVLQWARAGGLRWAGMAIVTAIILSRGYELAHYYTVYHGFKPRWKEVTEYVMERRQPGESVYASTGDVMEFYAGRGTARWISDKTMATAPEPGAWYAVYSAGVPFRHDVSARYREISRVAVLMEVFPLHYGAKDRTIAVFHTPQLPSEDRQ